MTPYNRMFLDMHNLYMLNYSNVYSYVGTLVVVSEVFQ